MKTLPKNWATGGLDGFVQKQAGWNPIPEAPVTLLSSSRAWPPVNPALTVQGYSHTWQPQLAVPRNSPLILAGKPELVTSESPQGHHVWTYLEPRWELG